MLKLVTLLSPLIFSISGIARQSLNYGIDIGVNAFSTSEKLHDRIRGDNANYNQYPNFNTSTPDHLSTSNYSFYAGAKVEKLVWRNQLGVSLGLRYLRMQSNLGKKSYYDSPSSYFYFLYKEDGLTTEYLTIKSITENTNFLTVPIEARLYPFEKSRFKIHFKISAELGYTINTNQDIEFNDSQMKEYENEVEAIIGKPKSFYSTLGLGVGYKFKKVIRVELNLPMTFISSGNSALFKPSLGAGVQLVAMLPTKSTMQ